MASLSLPPPSRIAVGSVTVNGQRLDVILNPEWGRYFESLNTQVNTTGAAVGQPGAPGTTGAAGFGVCMEGDGGSDDLCIPGPTGQQGPQGTPGPALFLLAEPEVPDALPMIPTQLTEAFIAPTLLNSWVYWGSTFNPPGYCKDAQGLVHLRGLIRSGTATAGTQLFALPAGYRPANQEVYAVCSNSAFGEVRIDAAGSVTIQTGSNVFLSLDGITFKAA